MAHTNPPTGLAEYRLPPVPDQHRGRSAEMILRAAGEVESASVVVFGAGRCEEIPLAALAQRFRRVVLHDNQPELLEQAVAEAGLSISDRLKVYLAPLDLVGITDELVKTCRQAVAGALDLDRAIDGVAVAVSSAEPVTPEPRRYDLVVSSCVLSQLTFSLIQEVRQAIVDRFPQSQNRVQADPALTGAIEGLTRRCEAAFVDLLASSVTDEGRIYFSDTVQLCFVRRTEQGDWSTPGTWRMTKTLRIDDYLDRRFTVDARSRWNWVVNPPQALGEEGRLYDVQATILRLA